MLEMADDSKELEEKFLELGKELESPPSAAAELVTLLDLVDGYLSRIEQSPSQSMLDALQPVMKALSVEELLRHSDTDVKVSVASCVSEVTRITAPEAPYDDDIMKDVFKIIVESFEALDDMSNCSFHKRVSILETVAKVRSCVVMLDLECDALILQMFHYFLKTIRTDHPETVLTSMETIMTLVIEESEDISSELLSALLDTLKTDNKDVLPFAHKLAEQVISTCASKIKPYIVELIQSAGVPMSKYSKVVEAVCLENPDILDQNEVHASGDAMADDKKLSERTVSDELPQASELQDLEVGFIEEVGKAADNLPIEATSNCATQSRNDESMEQPSSPKQPADTDRHNGHSANVVSDNSDAHNSEQASAKPDEDADLEKEKGRNNADLEKEKGQNTNSSSQIKVTDNSRIDSDKDYPVVVRRRKGRSKGSDSSQVDISTKKVEPAVPSEPEKANEHQHLSEPADSIDTEKKDELQRVSGTDNLTAVTSPTSDGSPSNTARTKRGRPSRSKARSKSTGKHTDGDLEAEPAPSASVQKDAGNSQIHAEEIDDHECKEELEDADDGEAPTSLTINSKERPKRAGKRGLSKKKTAESESSDKKQTSDTKEQNDEDTFGKVSLKELASSRRSASKALRSNQKDLDHSLKRESRRKRPLNSDISETPGDKKEMDENLVGSKIKVWWPDDEAFYDGIVKSYDRKTHKHTIDYTDGDIEVLLLKDERWEHIDSDMEKIQGKQEGEENASQISQSKKAKSSSKTTSKQAKSPAQTRSGTDSSSKAQKKLGGRPRKLSYEDSTGTSKKLRGRTANSNSTGGEVPEDEPESKTLNTNSETRNKSKARGSKADIVAKGGNSKLHVKSKDSPSKSGRRSKNETPKSSTMLKNDSSKASSNSGDDARKLEPTPKTAKKYEVDVAAKNKTPRGKSKMASTPGTVGDSKENGISSKGKSKAGRSDNTPLSSDGEATTTGRKRKRMSRK